jgi:hypothetical protein
MKNWTFILALLVCCLMVGGPVEAGYHQAIAQEERLDSFTFAITADMRNFTSGIYGNSDYFAGALQALKTMPPAAFMLTPGDMDPPADVRGAIDRELGSDYIWYPVIGNHELPGAGSESSLGANLAWLNAWPANYANSSSYQFVRMGPATCPNTTYSFDYKNAHFAILNEYCNSTGDHATDGNISYGGTLYTWLLNDLSASDKPFKFVVGHEPAYPQPDADVTPPLARHVGDSLDQYPYNRDKFWEMLAGQKVLAYINGHTHVYSVYHKGGVWQLDAGHARGKGDMGAPSTFMLLTVSPGMVTYQTYRTQANNDPLSYHLAHQGVLSAKQVFLPVVVE